MFDDSHIKSVDLTVEGLGPWSHSKYKVLTKCPFQFYLKYICKFKPVNKAPETLVTHVGSAAHLILEKVAIGKNIDDSFAAARREFLDKLTKEEWEEHVDSLHYSIQSFKNRIDAFGVANPISRVWTEMKIGVTRDWQPTGFFSDNVYFRGIIDLGLNLKSGDVLLIDHKTGAVAEQGLRAFKDQLDTYKVLYHYGMQPIVGAQSGIHYIRQQEVRFDDYVGKDEIENKLRPNLEFSLQGAIDSAVEEGYFKHKAHSGCKYCDYAVECKGKELKQLEAKTVRFFKKPKIE